MSWIEKLKTRWGLKSAFQVVIVLVVFACTGTSVLFIKKPLFTLLGVDESMDYWLRTVIYIFTILPAYQVLLLFYGFIFGQFKFFWEFEKKMFRRMLFIKEKKKEQLNERA